jgi:hypothetical protein
MLRKLLLVVAAAAVLAGPQRSEAQVGIGARIGYAFGTGDVLADEFGTLKMSDYTKAQIPIQVDLMFHVIPGLSIGPYFSYGFGQTGGQLDDTCRATGLDCSTSVIRLGAQLTYTLPPPLPLWVGAGLGYEWNRLDSGNSTSTVKGIELLNLQAGLDFMATPMLRFGPFVMVSFGRYGSGDLGAFASIRDEKIHEWIEIGFRGMLDL